MPSHNIVLDDGTHIHADSVPLEQLSQFHAVARCLKALYPHGFDGLRVADLACAEGSYAVGLARMGFEVLGIEIRRANYATCCFVKQRVDLPKLSFVQDNVWNLERYERSMPSCAAASCIISTGQSSFSTSWRGAYVGRC